MTMSAARGICSLALIGQLLGGCAQTADIPPAGAENGDQSCCPADYSYMVFFDWNSTAINDESRGIIADAVTMFRAIGASTIVLSGHADRSGPAGYNLVLSRKRAEAVKALVTALGIAAGRVVTIGKGERWPQVPTQDGVRDPQNRRVEFVFE
ncbi:OmpA family protein [Oleomonas cavernae]|nr:OmpA family protein [Oleomonas cavernae]